MSKLGYNQWILATITILVGLNLRPIMASISPIIPVLIDTVGINNQTAGLLTTVPVAMMGCFALLGPRIQSRVSEYLGILAGLLAIALSCTYRFFVDSVLLLLITSLIGGIGIAIIQTLMPAYLKRMTPENASVFMGLFTTGIMAGAAISAATVSPLEGVFGWNIALSIMAIPTILAIILFASGMPRIESSRNGYLPLPLKSKNAWLLMLFFGIGTGAYTLVLAWLPLNYTQLGWSRDASGALLSILTVAEVISGILISIFIKKLTDRRKPLFITLSLILIGLVLLIYIPSKLAFLTVIILGLGIGALFPLSLIVALDYASSAKQAATLLAFVQGGGYLIASAFPLIAGVLVDSSSDLTGSWVGMIIGILLLLAMCKKFSPRDFVVWY
ncbi:MFS transporter [Psychrobacter piscatorii]|uniref:MFS transporter n=1 Tax=Psychrobacter piscatorii TaxID=554343 RepID=UPI00191AAC95|nr:MFS transporter [Psychrobacter piscatorii]